MKKTKRKRPVKRSGKQAWIQQTAQWRKDIFVCTDYSAKEIVAAIKKQKAEQWMIDFVEKQEESWQKLIDRGCAFVAAEERHGSLILRLRPFQDAWEFWETLLHELSHVVDFMTDCQGFEKEGEAKAYLIEYLFREIRRKLIGVEKYHENGL